MLVVASEMTPPGAPGAKKIKQRQHFYWDVVFEEKGEMSSREKMTKSRAKNMLNVSEDEKITHTTVYKAWRRLTYPPELKNFRGKNEDGHSLVDYHEAYQHLSKFVKPESKANLSELEADSK